MLRGEAFKGRSHLARAGLQHLRVGDDHDVLLVHVVQHIVVEFDDRAGVDGACGVREVEAAVGAFELHSGYAHCLQCARGARRGRQCVKGI